MNLHLYLVSLHTKKRYKKQNTNLFKIRILDTISILGYSKFYNCIQIYKYIVITTGELRCFFI